MFLASVLVIGIQTANFAYVWFSQYNYRSVIGSVYWRRGHWALFALYALIVLLMSRLFGALKVGYMRVLDVIISQILSVASQFVSHLSHGIVDPQCPGQLHRKIQDKYDGCRLDEEYPDIFGYQIRGL